MAKLVLVREGQSEWDREKKFAGLEDVPLAEEGRSQAVAAGLVLFEDTMPIDFAYRAMHSRTRETAELIVQLLDFKLEIFETAALNERDYGIYTGSKAHEIGRSTMRLIQGWDFPIEGGNTVQDVHNKAIVPFHKSVASPLLREDENVMVVAPFSPLQAYVKLLEDVPETEVADISIAPGEVRIYDMDDLARVTNVRSVDPNRH